MGTTHAPRPQVSGEVRTPNYISLGILTLEYHENGTVSATLEDSGPWTFLSIANFMDGKNGDDDLRFIICRRDREQLGCTLARALITLVEPKKHDQVDE